MKKVCQYCADVATIVGLCSAHYQYQRRWMKAGVKHAREHAEKLRTRGLLMEGMVPGVPSQTNVVELSSHPRFAAKRATTNKRRRKRVAG